MEKYYVLLIILFPLVIGILHALASPHVFWWGDNGSRDNYNGWIRVFFTPWEGDEAHSFIIYLIDNASESVYVAAYSLWDDDIKDALKSAHDRGVDVRIVIEGEHEDQVSDLEEYGIPVVAETGKKLMHNKFMIIDHHIVVTGSANWGPTFFYTLQQHSRNRSSGNS